MLAGGGGLSPFVANPGLGGFSPPPMAGEFGGGGPQPGGFVIGNEFPIQPPAQQLLGQKRGFPFSNGLEPSDRICFIKLFVGQYQGHPLKKFAQYSKNMEKFWRLLLLKTGELDNNKQYNHPLIVEVLQLSVGISA